MKNFLIKEYMQYGNILRPLNGNAIRKLSDRQIAELIIECIMDFVCEIKAAVPLEDVDFDKIEWIVKPSDEQPETSMSYLEGMTGLGWKYKHKN